MITYAVKKTKNPKGAEGISYHHAIKTGELTMEKPHLIDHQPYQGSYAEDGEGAELLEV